MASFFSFLCCSVTEQVQHEQDVEEIFDDFLFRGGRPRLEERVFKATDDDPQHETSMTTMSIPDDVASNKTAISADSSQTGPFLEEPSELSAALDRCELLEAARLVSSKVITEEHQGLLGPGGMGRLRNVAAQYEASLDKISLSPSNMPVFGALPEYDFEYGLELQSHSFMLVVTVTWHLASMDELLRFAALYVSKDCSPGWDSTVHKVEPLGQQTAAQAVWRVHGVDGVGVKTDDVLRRNWLIPEKQSPYDAWVVEVSATDDDQSLGVPLPPVDAGHVRAADVMKFTALTGDHEKGGAGFTLKVRHVLTVCPGPLSMTLMRFMPKWGLRKALGSALERAVRLTPEHVQKNRRALEDTVRGPAARFYAALSSRILQKS